MIIINQKKSALINFENVADIYIDNKETNKKIYATSSSGITQYTLGEYKTEERAKEVLSSIIASYQASKMFECANEEVQSQMSNKYIKVGTEPFKYEMPEE